MPTATASSHNQYHAGMFIFSLLCCPRLSLSLEYLLDHYSSSLATVSLSLYIIIHLPALVIHSFAKFTSFCHS
ncbi:uncharacterized protein BJ212DRAFT_1353749 [Suillus subaureus]|uniref:Uncharacterized protein n=1 Tax=Suillus subaureus TaxID=48587 RepID=A0A9P7EBX8_9AGAM|nr:uncharacterized protein BJ212DRAFT_1353749 [Suillus subaureus]KAG1816864.1 hypothetical protein BJ212DRAFT_1353749 [Suillus subaureus]